MPFIWLFLSPLGLCVQCINRVLSLSVLLVYLLVVLSSVIAAWLNIGDSFSMECPRALRH